MLHCGLELPDGVFCGLQVLGHNALYITVGLAWLFFANDGAAGDEVTIRQDDGPYGYQLGANAVFPHLRR
jgi:hypothetical protein